MRSKNKSKVPHSDDAEKGLLGSCLIADTARASIMGNLISEQFFNPAHQTIFRRIQAMLSTRKPIDLISVTQELDDAGELQRCGGAGYITELFTFVSSPANWPYYIEIVEEKWRLRGLMDIGKRLASGDDIPGALAELHQLEAAGKDSFPAIINAGDWCSSPVNLPEELIGSMLHRGGKLVLGGGSKSFKTWTLLDLGLSVSAGVPFLGFDCHKGRSLFVNLEIQGEFFKQRINEICTAKGIAPKNLDVLNLRGFAADAAALIPKIIQRATSEKYALLVLDPLYKLLGGRDENSSSDMAELMNAVERLSVETGAAVAFGSHFAKGNASGKESMDRISGSGVFARDPDSIVTMTRHEVDDAFTVEMTLRNHPPQEPFVVRRRHPLMVPDGALDPAKLKQAVGRTATHTASDALDLLTEPMTSTEWQKGCEDEGISRRTFFRLRQQLEKEGKIFCSKLDNKWSVKP